MTAKLGNQNIANFYLGSLQLSKLFAGELEIWPNTIPPVGGYPDKQIVPQPYGPIPEPVNATPFKAFSSALNDNVYAIAADANGNVYVGGVFTTYNGITSNRIVKIKPNGDLDATFNTGTGFDNRINSITIGPTTGNVYVAGFFTTYQGVARRAFVSLNATNGNLITHYNVVTTVTGYVLEEQNDGTVMVGGTAGICRRYSIAGVHDSSFVFSTGTNAIRTIAKFKDGSNKYIIARQTGFPGIVIVDANGTIDTVATANMNVTAGFSESYAHLPNNKIAIGTASMRYGGYKTPHMIVGSDGIFDVTFAINTSKATTGQTNTIRYKDGVVIVTGTISQGSEYPFNVFADYVLFDLEGTFIGADNLFEFSMFLWASALNAQGNLLVGGTLRQSPNFLNFQPVSSSIYQAAFTTSSWSTNSEQYDFTAGFTGTVYTIEKYKDKLLVGGELESYNGTPITSNLVRLNTDGTLDYTFAPTNITGKVNKVTWIFGTEVVLVGGAFAGHLKAYNENGSENTAWTTTFDGEVRAIFYDRYKKKVVVGGAFTKGIRVLTQYGVEDATFNIGTGFNGRVNDVYWENARSKRMTVVGNFTQYNGTTTNIPKITTLNADGTLITSTITGTGFVGEPYCLFPNSSLTQIFVGGAFSNYNGNAAGNFAYLRLDTLESDAVGETVNNAFTRPNQFNGPVYQIAYLNNRSGIATFVQNYLVVGDFTSYVVGEPGYGMKTIAARGVARLGEGYYDIPNNWQERTSTNGPVYAVKSQFSNMLPSTTTYNNWIIGGAFAQYSGSVVNSIVQITTSGSLA